MNTKIRATIKIFSLGFVVVSGILIMRNINAFSQGMFLIPVEELIFFIFYTLVSFLVFAWAFAHSRQIEIRKSRFNAMRKKRI